MLPNETEIKVMPLSGADITIKKGELYLTKMQIKQAVKELYAAECKHLDTMHTRLDELILSEKLATFLLRGDTNAK